MQLQQLDSDYRAVNLVEGYNSLIWTERFREAGDFQLKTSQIQKTRDLLPVGAFVGIQDSWELMFVEDHQIDPTDKGDELTVTGRSIIAMTEARTLTDNLKYYDTQAPEARFIMYGTGYGDGTYPWLSAMVQLCRLTGATSQDKEDTDQAYNDAYLATWNTWHDAPAGKSQPSRLAPNYPNDAFFGTDVRIYYEGYVREADGSPFDNSSENRQWLRWYPYRSDEDPYFYHDTASPDSLGSDGYSYMMGILKERNRGLRFIRPERLLYNNWGPTESYWIITDPIDRSINQTTRPQIVFSHKAGHLENPKYLWSNKDYRNIAYVNAPIGFKIVAAPGVSTSVSGLNRRVLTVDASDLTKAGESVSQALLHRGQIELASWNKTKLVEVEVSKKLPYRFGDPIQTYSAEEVDGKQANGIDLTNHGKIDYSLGDYVTVEAEYDITQTMQVTEYIRTEDSEGNTSAYPTLALVDYLT